MCGLSPCESGVDEKQNEQCLFLFKVDPKINSVVLSAHVHTGLHRLSLIVCLPSLVF